MLSADNNIWSNGELCKERLERLSACGEERFTNALQLVKTDAASLKSLIDRVTVTRGRTLKVAEHFDKQGRQVSEDYSTIEADCHLSEAELNRAVTKLLWFLKAGFKLGREIDSQLTITSFAVPTDHELQMSDREFSTLWSDESAATRKRIRIEKGLIPDDSGRLVATKKREKTKTVKLVCAKRDQVFHALRRTRKCSQCGGPPDPTKRYCGLGENCLRSEKGRAQECPPRLEYCSEVCLGAHQAAVRRLRASV